MTRLILQVVYLWRYVSSTAPPFILWWPNFEILLGPLHRSSPFIGELRCQALQMVLYSRENPKRSLYCEMAVLSLTVSVARKPNKIPWGRKSLGPNCLPDFSERAEKQLLYSSNFHKTATFPLKKFLISIILLNCCPTILHSELFYKNEILIYMSKCYVGPNFFARGRISLLIWKKIFHSWQHWFWKC
jgi:hypothetical protein